MQVDQPGDEEFYNEEPDMSDSPDCPYYPDNHPPSQPSNPMDIPSPLPQGVPLVTSQGNSQHVNDNGRADTRIENGLGSNHNSQQTFDSFSDSEFIEVDMNDGMDDVTNGPVSQTSDFISSPRGSPSPIPTKDLSIWSLSSIRVLNSLTDALRYQLCMDRFFHPNGLMQPRDQDLSSLDANGKAWVMERPPLSQPIDGNTWSFVDECHAGITSELLKVIYFFDIMNGLSNHFNWNGFVVSTGDISGGSGPVFLQPSYAPNNKDINGVTLSQFVESDENISLKGVSTGVDAGRLLYASELNSSGMVNTSLQLFRISVSFTAAVFESSRVKRHPRRVGRDQDDSDNEEEQQQAIFGVVTITALRNVDTLRLIMVCSNTVLSDSIYFNWLLDPIVFYWASGDVFSDLRFGVPLIPLFE